MLTFKRALYAMCGYKVFYDMHVLYINNLCLASRETQESLV